MRKAKKKNRITILLFIAVGIVSFIMLQYIINTDLANRNLELFPFFGLFVSFIFLVLNIGTFIQLKRLERRMKHIENTHESISRLYFASTTPKSQTNIFSVVLRIDGETPLGGLGDYGKFIYLFDKVVQNDKEFVQTTEIIIAPSFFSDRYGLEGVFAIIDYAFVLPKSNYLLVFDEQKRNFGIFPNWLGEKVEEIEKGLKLADIIIE